MSVASEIRRIRALKVRYDEAANEKIGTLVASCRHERAVVLQSAYSGSRSYDYDDAHEELVGLE